MAATSTWILAPLCALALYLTLCNGVRVGDEQFESAPVGQFYAFAVGKIHIIDPPTGKVVKIVPVPGVATWGDAVYVQSPDGSKAFAVAVDRDNHQLLVLDALTGDIVEKIPVGKNPFHVYVLAERGEVWMHSDDDGHFDVWRVDTPSKLLEAGFKAHVDVPGHGKLLFDPALGDVGYATNEKEQGIFELDLKAKEHLGDKLIFYNMTELNDDGATCDGTHGIAYSKVNNHVYVECLGGGVFEFDRRTKRVIGRFPDFFGQLYATPDEAFVMTIAKEDNTIHLLQPRGVKQASKLHKSFVVPGNPSRVVYRPKELQESKVELRDYEAWFSLTEDDEDAGVAWVDLFEVVGIKKNRPKRSSAAKVISTGTVFRGTPNAAKVISSGGTVHRGSESTHRSIARGGKWIAIPTHLPEQSISIFNAETKTLEASAPGMTNTSRVLWVPVPLQTI